MNNISKRGEKIMISVLIAVALLMIVGVGFRLYNNKVLIKTEHKTEWFNSVPSYDNDWSKTYEVYKYLVSEEAIEIENSTWWSRILAGIIKEKYILAFRYGKANCNEISNMLIDMSKDIGVRSNFLELIYINKDYEVTSDYRNAVHCAVVLNDKGRSGGILDISMAKEYGAIEGLFGNIEGGESCEELWVEAFKQRTGYYSKEDA